MKTVHNLARAIGVRGEGLSLDDPSKFTAAPGGSAEYRGVPISELLVPLTTTGSVSSRSPRIGYLHKTVFSL